MPPASIDRTCGDYELRQLIGQRRRRDMKIVTVQNPVDQVFYCGERIGYIGRYPGAPFCPLRPRMSPDETQQALDAIKEIRAKDGFFGVPGGAAIYPSGVTAELIESTQRQARQKEEQENEEDEGDYDDDAEY